MYPELVKSTYISIGSRVPFKDVLDKEGEWLNTRCEITQDVSIN